MSHARRYIALGTSESRFTVELLRQYSAAALNNADELLQESSLLYEHGHSARAYFLAVASIEETGKAMLAFVGQGRNLSDPAVTTKLSQALQSHSQKITAAFIAVFSPEALDEELVMSVIHYTIHLKNGREPSMYTDIEWGSSKVQIPASIVRTVAARDCVKLARNCLFLAKKHISEKKPDTRSRVEDQLFTMRAKDLTAIQNDQDFWWYYINEMKLGRKDFAAAVVGYRKNFILTGKRFNLENGPPLKEGPATLGDEPFSR